jgi:hypothetical protein
MRTFSRTNRILSAALLIAVGICAPASCTNTGNKPLSPNAKEHFELEVFQLAPGATQTEERDRAAESGRLIDGDKYSEPRTKMRSYHFARPVPLAEFWKWAVAVYPTPGWTRSTTSPETEGQLICIKDKPNGARHHITIVLLRKPGALDAEDYKIIYSL